VGSPANDVVRSYFTLASSLLDRWSAHASKVATKLDAGDYDADSAAADLAACASLATEGGFLLASETLDAVAVLAGRGYDRNVVLSQPFQAPPGARLKLAGPLVKGPGFDELPVGVLLIQPFKLAPAETEFALRADATGHRGGTYVGKVQASTGAAAPVNVTVWITVP
jgi:hypothetical protein